jgi:colanic acid/amylovoran biosynthesis glycosyltransferase
MTSGSDNRGRIGYVLSTFPSLTETFIAREIEALKRRGFEIVVFAVRRPTFMPSGQTPSGADTLGSCVYARPDRLLRHLVLNLYASIRHPIRYFSAFRVFMRGWADLEPGVLARLLYHFACGVGFSWEMRRLRIDHLHCHFASGCSVALAANLFSGITYSFTAHASSDLFVKPVLLPLKVRHALRVVPVCEYSKRYLDAVTGFAYSSKLHRVYNGVDVNEASRLAPTTEDNLAEEQGSPAAIRLLSVGSLVGVKGHSTLIEVCRRLREEGHTVQCKIVGGGPEHEVLARLIVKAGLTSIVELSGPLPLGEVYRAMRLADIFVLLSEIGVNGYRDGFPTVILEAMAMGLPVVSTWVSGIPEMVEHQVTGILVPERDPSAAAAAVRRLLQDPALRMEMGSAGRQRVSRLFALDQSADELAGLLAETLSARGELARAGTADTLTLPA